MNMKSLPPERVREFVIAAHSDLLKVQEMFAETPELINVPNPQTNETALDAAAHMGRGDIAEFILAQGVPLHICAAAMLGRREAVADFLATDPQLAQARGAHGIPLLFHVALSGDLEIGDMILAHGGGEGLYAALHGAVTQRHLEMVRWLLDHGASTQAKNYQGDSPLAVARAKREEEIALLLETAGAS